MATDFGFAGGRKVRLRAREESDPISFLPGLSAHQLVLNLESETISGVEPETYPLADLVGEVHCVNHRQIDRWLGAIAPGVLILRPDPIATMLRLAVTLDDAAVIALDEMVGGQDFTLRLELRANLTASSAWPEAVGQMNLRVSGNLWQRQIKALSRTISFTGSIPVPTIEGSLAEAAKHLRDAEQQLLSAQWTDAVRLTRLAHDVMKKFGGLPKPDFKRPLDERSLGEKYANAMWTVFELASVPQHAGAAQKEELGRADAYAFFWMTAALYYKLVDAARP